MESQLESLAAGVAIVRKELDAIDEVIRTELLTSAALQQQLEAAALELEQSIKRVLALEREASEKVAEEEDLKLVLQDLQRQIATLNSQHLELEEAVPRERRELERKAAALEQQSDTFARKHSNTAWQEAKRATEHRRVSLEEELQAQRAELLSYRSEWQSKSTCLREERVTAAALETELRELETSISRTTSSHQVASSRLASLSAPDHPVTALLERQRLELQSLQAQCEQAVRAVTNMEAEVEATEREQAAQQLAAKAMEDQLQQLQARIGEMLPPIDSDDDGDNGAYDRGRVNDRTEAAHAVNNGGSKGGLRQGQSHQRIPPPHQQQQQQQPMRAPQCQSVGGGGWSHRPYQSDGRGQPQHQMAPPQQPQMPPPPPAQLHMPTPLQPPQHQIQQQQQQQMQCQEQRHGPVEHQHGWKRIGGGAHDSERGGCGGRRDCVRHTKPPAHTAEWVDGQDNITGDTQWQQQDQQQPRQRQRNEEKVATPQYVVSAPEEDMDVEERPLGGVQHEPGLQRGHGYGAAADWPRRRRHGNGWVGSIAADSSGAATEATTATAGNGGQRWATNVEPQRRAAADGHRDEDWDAMDGYEDLDLDLDLSQGDLEYKNGFHGISVGRRVDNGGGGGDPHRFPPSKFPPSGYPLHEAAAPVGLESQGGTATAAAGTVAGAGSAGGAATGIPFSEGWVGQQGQQKDRHHHYGHWRLPPAPPQPTAKGRHHHYHHGQDIRQGGSDTGGSVGINNSSCGVAGGAGDGTGARQAVLYQETVITRTFQATSKSLLQKKITVQEHRVGIMAGGMATGSGGGDAGAAGGGNRGSSDHMAATAVVVREELTRIQRGAHRTGAADVDIVATDGAEVPPPPPPPVAGDSAPGSTAACAPPASKDPSARQQRDGRTHLICVGPGGGPGGGADMAATDGDNTDRRLVSGGTFGGAAGDARGEASGRGQMPRGQSPAATASTGGHIVAGSMQSQHRTPLHPTAQHAGTSQLAAGTPVPLCPAPLPLPLQHQHQHQQPSRLPPPPPQQHVPLPHPHPAAQKQEQQEQLYWTQAPAPHLRHGQYSGPQHGAQTYAHEIKPQMGPPPPPPPPLQNPSPSQPPLQPPPPPQQAHPVSEHEHPQPYQFQRQLHGSAPLQRSAEQSVNEDSGGGGGCRGGDGFGGLGIGAGMGARAVHPLPGPYAQTQKYQPPQQQQQHQEHHHHHSGRHAQIRSTLSASHLHQSMPPPPPPPVHLQQQHPRPESQTQRHAQTHPQLHPPPPPPPPQQQQHSAQSPQNSLPPTGGPGPGQMEGMGGHRASQQIAPVCTVKRKRTRETDLGDQDDGGGENGPRKSARGRGGRAGGGAGRGCRSGTATGKETTGRGAGDTTARGGRVRARGGAAARASRPAATLDAFGGTEEWQGL